MRNDESDGGPFWSRRADEVIARLDTSAQGLTAAAVETRLKQFGPNAVSEQAGLPTLRFVLRQFESPLVLILVAGAIASLFLGEWFDAALILAIVLGSTMLGFTQEFRASRAVAELKQRLALTTRALRNGIETVVPVAGLVPGDVVLLSAGNLVPADGLILEARDFLVTESSLTGESFPVEKRPGIFPADAPVGARTNAVFMGSSVRSGTARVLLVETGLRTAFGAIAMRLQAGESETEFERGVRQFGQTLVRVMILTVIFVLTINQLLGRPVADSLLFAVALAVGLSPELLPAIISVTLSSGARHLAKSGVLVRRLDAIEDLGGMDVLCMDKTGTLTEGMIVLHEAADAEGAASSEVRLLAFLNATFESGIENPLDTAIVEMGKREGLLVDGFRKIDEIPYDFARRSLTIVVEDARDTSTHRLITKGAFANVLAACTAVKWQGAERPLDNEVRQHLERYFQMNGEQGFRVLALAERRLPARTAYSREDEAGMTLLGFLLFRDPPKLSAAAAMHDLARLGVSLKVISGDNRFVTAHLAQSLGMTQRKLLLGEDLNRMKDEALLHAVQSTDLFVEVDPQLKERIVRALQKVGHAVGFLGDGINDAPALHAADVGISVDRAVDIARESADVVLLRPDLHVLCRGVEDGRKIFANTLKYISITTSANFGNMMSMAVATPFLPFLPLLPKQILLNNFLSDLPSIAISTDNVDREHVREPQRWHIAEVRRFMITFGFISSVFDLLTFAALLLVFQAGKAEFQTAWFVVSLLTELAVVLVLRTKAPALTSRPSRLLAASTGAVCALTLALPYLSPLAGLFGLVALSPALLAITVAIVTGYVGVTEVAKRWFYRQRGWHLGA